MGGKDGGLGIGLSRGGVAASGCATIVVTKRKKRVVATARRGMFTMAILGNWNWMGDVEGSKLVYQGA